MQCYDGTDSCAIVVPIRRYCQIGNELFQKLAEIEDITVLSKEDQEKYDDAIRVMRNHIAAYKGAIIGGKIEVAKNMLMENEPIDKTAKYTGLSEDELLRIMADCSNTQGVTLG